MSKFTSIVIAVAVGIVVPRPLAGQPARTVAAPAEFGMASANSILLTCDFRYPDRALIDLVQGGEPELRITIKSTREGPQYHLQSVEQAPDPGSFRKDFIRATGDIAGATVPDPYQTIRVYDVRLKVADDAPPRPYDVGLTFEEDRHRSKPEYRKIRLFVGAKQTKEYVTADADPSVADIVAGETSPLSLLVHNQFPTYVVTVRRIKVTSSPPGLIEDIDQPLSDLVSHGDPKRMDLRIKGTWSLSSLSPFGQKPSLNVSLFFDDGFRVDQERLPSIPISSRLELPASVAWGIALLSVLIGAIGGAWIRLRFAQTPAIETGLSNGARMTASIIFALVLVLLTLVLRVEVIAGSLSDFRIPLYNPFVAFVLSFVIALYDPSRLVEYVRDKAGLDKRGAAVSK